MSRVVCPHCGKKMIASTALRKADWGVHGDTKGTGMVETAVIARLYFDGLSEGAIAQQFDVSPQFVREVLIKEGLIT